MRKVPLRLMLVVIPLALLGAGLVEWVRLDPAFMTEGGADGLRVGLRLAGFTQFGGGFSVGFLPFWPAASLVVGLVSMILLYAVGDLKDTLRWSAPLLLLLWVLQLATIVSIYPQGPNTEGPPISFSYWLTRPTYIGSSCGDWSCCLSWSSPLPWEVG